MFAATLDCLRLLFVVAVLLFQSSPALADAASADAAYDAKRWAVAFTQYQPVAAQGNPAAQRRLGWLYETGQGTTRNVAQAMLWYRKAAEQGDAQAQANLGLIYASGADIPPNDAEALIWFRKSALQGNAAGQFSLGFAYAHANGVPRDNVQAVAWYRKSAAQGNADAQTYLGTMYENGWGVPQDYAQAMAWYRKAAAQGQTLAKDLLGILIAAGAPDSGRADRPSLTNCTAKCNSQCAEYSSGSLIPQINSYCFVPCNGTCEAQNNLSR